MLRRFKVAIYTHVCGVSSRLRFWWVCKKEATFHRTLPHTHGSTHHLAVNRPQSRNYIAQNYTFPNSTFINYETRACVSVCVCLLSSLIFIKHFALCVSGYFAPLKHKSHPTHPSIPVYSVIKTRTPSKKNINFHTF